MPTLPDQPNLDQLRHQARDLLRAANAGERAATEQIRSVSGSGRLTLAAAQLAVARGYGFPSWPALKDHVEAQRRTLAEAAEAFLHESVRGRIGRAGRLLAQHPGISGYDVRTAVALGDADRVGTELKRDPGLAARQDPRTGWTALHLACASRWHVDPIRAEGLLTIVGMLLDAGADLHRPPAAGSQWRPLRCAVASTTSGRGNASIIRLLLDRGAQVEDHDLYLAGFASGGEQWCVRLLLEYTPDARAIAEQALAAPISLQDLDGVRVLLDGGADPGRYRDDDGRPAAVVLAAIAADCSLELIELLLAHGADPNRPGQDGRSAYAVATANGRAELLELLERHGARDDASALDRLRYACLRGDRSGALEQLDQDPTLRSRLDETDGSALIGAAETGNVQGIKLLLEVGFPAAAPSATNGANALHSAAYAGSAEVVRELLAAGAPLESRDDTWHSSPLEWALVGSGERPTTNPAPDWIEVVRALLDAGAATDEITLDPDDPKPPSAEVTEFLRRRGRGADDASGSS